MANAWGPVSTWDDPRDPRIDSPFGVSKEDYKVTSYLKAGPDDVKLGEKEILDFELVNDDGGTPHDESDDTVTITTTYKDKRSFHRDTVTVSRAYDEGRITSGDDTVTRPGGHWPDLEYKFELEGKKTGGSRSRYTPPSYTPPSTPNPNPNPNPNPWNPVAPSSPEARSLKVEEGDYCTNPSHVFSWTYFHPQGKKESKYRLQVDDNNSFNSPEIDSEYNDASSNGGENYQRKRVTSEADSGRLDYNKEYYWRVRVWDEDGNKSDWILGDKFETYAHRWPKVDFSWSPEKIIKNREIEFKDESESFGGTEINHWSWDFEGGEPNNSPEENPEVVFTSEGGKTIKLKARDSDGYECPGVKDVTVREFSTKWEETSL
ncbi:MAG: hypothetical protein U5L10_05670 [Candidatus Moranbacteria bacterium]|nr:hypothetical protein [Candidatus Moranbacteria bacterium]